MTLVFLVGGFYAPAECNPTECCASQSRWQIQNSQQSMDSSPTTSCSWLQTWQHVWLTGTLTHIQHYNPGQHVAMLMLPDRSSVLLSFYLSSWNLLQKSLKMWSLARSFWIFTFSLFRRWWSVGGSCWWGFWTKLTTAPRPMVWSTAAMSYTEERPVANCSVAWLDSSLLTCSSTGALLWVRSQI